jgi:hypothetical protein
MPNILALSLRPNSPSLTTPRPYQRLLPSLLRRAAVHEARIFEDAMSWIRTGWSSIILIMDAFIVDQNNDSSFVLRQAFKTVTRTGCTTIFMGNFASTATDLNDLDDLWEFLANFPCTWSPTEWAVRDATSIVEQTQAITPPDYYPRMSINALWLECDRHREESVVYQVENLETCAIIERCGMGRVGYVGDVDLNGQACGIARDQALEEECLTMNRISVGYRREN